MKRLFTVFLVTSLAGQALAQTTFTVGNLEYTVIDADEHTVSVSAATNTLSGALTIEPTVTNENVSYRVTEIKDRGFENCRSLTSLTLPEHMTTIGQYAFNGCTGLTSITLPESLTTIKNNAFVNCQKVASFEIPNSVTTIGGYAFYNCYALTTLTIPRSVTSIGAGLCSFCTGLTAITVEAGNPNYVSVDGVLYTIDTTQLVQYPIGKNASSFVFPNTVTTIARSSFRGCTKLQSVTLPESLTSVAGYAFNKCSNLKTINIPSSVTCIDDHTFDGCQNLKVIAIPATVATIKEGAFSSCSNLTVYCEAEDIPDGWNSGWNPYVSSNPPVCNAIVEGDFVFRPSSDSTANVIGYIGSETDITIPETYTHNNTECSVTGVGSQAFSGNTSITSITVPETVTEIESGAFDDCNANVNYEGNANAVVFNNDTTVLISVATPLMGSYTIPSTVTRVCSFAGCTRLTAIVIPESVVTIDDGAFADCSALTSITTNNGIDLRNSGLYFTKDSIKYKVLAKNSVQVAQKTYTGEVVIPATVTAGNTFTITGIASGAFMNCSGLTSVTIPNGVTSIAYQTFRSCANLATVTLPDSLKTIGGYAFCDCSNLTTVNIPNAVTTIGERAFMNCSKLNPISIPDGVTSIGAVAFYGCSSLTSLTIPGSVESVGASAFEGCSGLTSVIIIDGTDEIGYKAFYNCSNLETTVIPSSVTTIGNNTFYGCQNATIYCEAETIPTGWSSSWNPYASSNPPVCNAIAEGDFVFRPSSDSTANVIGYIGSETVITIPATVSLKGTECAVTGIGSQAFSGNTNIASITIPETVTQIETGAFDNCSAFLNYEGNAGQTTITYEGVVFSSDTTVLISVDAPLTGSYTIPSTVTRVCSFAGCTGLTAIVIPESVVTIDDDAFASCTALTSITTNNGMDLKKSGLYFTKDNIKYKVLTKDAVQVEPKTYTGNLVIPETVAAGNTFTVTSIHGNAFRNCNNLTSLNLPKSITTIDADATYGCSLYGCIRLAEINVDDANTVYSSIGGVLFNKDKTELIRYPLNKSGAYTIPNTVTTIGREAFSYCDGLTSVTISNSVRRINYGAFEDCSYLTSVTIPEGVTTLESLVFNDCVSLASITIPESITSIPYAAFQYCSNLTTVNLPSTLVNVESSAFDNCSKLHYTEYDNACYLGNAQNPYVALIKAKSTSITSCVINDNCKVIASEAFSGCSNLTSITVPNSVCGIGGEAFGGCSALESITLPFVGDRRHSLTDDHQYPFGYIFGGDSYTGSVMAYQTTYYTDNTKTASSVYYLPSSLRTVTLTDCDYIQYGAFSGCNGLTSITIPASVTQIEDYAINFKNNLTIYCELKSAPKGWNSRWNSQNAPVVWGSADVVEGDYLSETGYYYNIIDSANVEIVGYAGTETEIVIPDTISANGVKYAVSRIGDNAFKSYTNLVSVTIPNTVTSIGNRAFLGCSGLTSITIGESVTSMGGCVFEECDKLTTVTIPESVVNIGNSTFYRCYNLTSVTLPDSLPKIGNRMFASCSKLGSVTIPNSVKSIGNDAFDGCSSLTSVTIPNSVTSFGDNVFANTGLTYVIIPNSVTSIGGWAFDKCRSLNWIFVPNSVKRLDWYFVRDCSKVTIYCEAESKPDGWMSGWNDNNRPVVWGFGANSIYNVTVAANESAYGTVKGGETVVSGTVVTISATPVAGYHFAKWSDNSTLNPRELTPTSDTALTALFEAHIPVADSAVAATCTETGLTAGSHCSVCHIVLVAQNTIPAAGHTEVVDPAVAATCTEPGLTAGKHCSVCHAVLVAQDTIPASHTVVVDPAVAATCTEPGLTEGSHCSVCDTVFVAQTEIPMIEHTAVTDTAVAATCSKKGLTEGSHCSVCDTVLVAQIETPMIEHTAVTDSAIAATYTSTGLTEGSHCSVCGYIIVKQTVIPKLDNGGGNTEPLVDTKDFTFTTADSIATITGYTGSETRITIPEKVVSGGKEYAVKAIGGQAFRNSKLVSVKIPNTVTAIGSEAFRGCTSLDTVNISDSVTEIGGGLFNGCSKLKSVNIPDGVTAIRGYAFYGCTSLAAITIPASVTTMSTNVFENCSNLTITCNVESKPDSWNDNWNPSNRPVVWKSPVEPDTEDFTFTIADGAATITGYTGSETRIAIPEKVVSGGKEYTVTAIGSGAFLGRGGLLEITIPNTVTRIAYQAFRRCTGLTSIVIPDSVTTIGGYAFYGCEALKSVKLSSSLTAISERAFFGCASLDSIVIPDSVKSIGAVAFYSCGLKSITIPGSVSSISYGMFRDCDNLTTISLPNTIEEVDGTAFEGCDKLEYNEYDSALYLGNAENPYVVLIKAKSTDITSCEINNNCKVIAEAAFKDCKGLTSFTVPNSVENIGYGAFSGCSSLESITLPFVGDKRHSFTDDHQYTFGYIFGNDDYEGGVATSQYYYNGDDGYHSTTYYIPSSLKSVVITDCEYIQFDAFDDCDNLTSITIPTSVTQIEESAFNGCSDNLTIYCDLKSAPRGWDLYLDSYNIVWGDVDVIDSSNVDGNFAYRIIDSTNAEIIDYLGSETEIVIPSVITKNGVQYTVTRIGDNAFKSYNEMKSVTIPNTVTSIGNKAFSSCYNLKSVEIPNSVKTIGSYTFEYCGGLTSVVIPNSVTTFGKGAFHNCYNLTSVEIPNSVTSISNSLFSYCSNLNSVTIPSSVTSIGYDAFSSCRSLATVDIPNSVTNIEESAFRWSGLTHIAIPSSITRLNGWTFDDCKNLEALIVPNSVTSTDWIVVRDCPKLTVYCEADSMPEKWDSYWNPDSCPVVWGADINSIFYLTVMPNNYEYGTVSGGGVVADGSTVTITATPAEGYKFVKWSNGLTTATATITVASDTTLVAEFAPDVETWTVALSANNSAYGRVSGGGTVTDGSTVTITATPAANYRFVKWSNGLTSATATITVTSDTTLVAEFEYVEPIMWTVTVSSSNREYGRASGSCTVADGSTITITATPAEGYEFIRWSNGLTNATETITVTSDLRLVAQFAEIVYAGTCGTDARWRFDMPTKTLTISGTGSIDSYKSVSVFSTEVNRPWQEIADQIEKVVIGEGITNLGSRAFCYCDNLKEVNISSTCTSYGSMSFAYCPKLKSVVVAATSVWQVNEYSFSNYDSCTLYVPAGKVDYYKNDIIFGMFSKVVGAYIVTVDAGMENGTVLIDNYAIDEGGSFTIIPKPADGYVVGKVLANGNAVDDYGTGIYTVFNVTANVLVSAEFSKVAQIEYDFTYNIISGTEVEITGYTGSETEITIPGTIVDNGVEYTVTKIADQAFSYRNITAVSIPNTVTAIGTEAFRGCDKLTEVNIPDNVTEIGGGLFNGCSILTKVNIPSGVTSIRGYAFYGCSSLKSIAIPASAKVNLNVFKNCSNLTIYCEAESQPDNWDSKWNPDNRPVVWGVRNPEDYVVPADETDFVFTIISESEHTVEISDCRGSQTDITIPKKVGINGVTYTVTRIGDYAFEYKSTLKSVTISETVTEIGNNAFAVCTNLTSIDIPNTVTTLGGYVFYSCESLQSLTIPRSVTKIGAGLCSFCTSLTEITVREGNENYVSVDGVLYNSDKTMLVMYPVGNDAESFVFPETVESTGRSSFRGCTNLTSVTFNDLLTTIGGYSFNKCDNLEKVVIKKPVTTIGDCTFMGCSSLKIYCEAESKPEGWDSSWNRDDRPVVWGYKPGTAVPESAATAVNIYAYSNTIVVENVTGEISVYDAMGRLVCRDVARNVSTEIRVNGTGVYIVKVGNESKRVMVND